MDEEIAAIEGCVRILEEMSEESADPRIWTMIAALRQAICALEALTDER